MRRHNDHLTIAAATILGIFSCPTFVLAELAEAERAVLRANSTRFNPDLPRQNASHQGRKKMNREVHCGLGGVQASPLPGERVTCVLTILSEHEPGE